MAEGSLPAEKPVSASRTEMVELVMPNDANPYGTIFGGRIMQLVDIAGSVAASRHAGQVVVTAAIEHLDFLRPVKVGDLLSIEAVVVNVGRTSLDVRATVTAENITSGERRLTGTALLTYVAVDPEGHPVPVGPVRAETEAERAWQEEARRRRASRR